ncbi:hypothetical protein Hanom_Chr12g01131461 [Helianthus anomalus]
MDLALYGLFNIIFNFIAELILLTRLIAEHNGNGDRKPPAKLKPATATATTALSGIQTLDLK